MNKQLHAVLMPGDAIRLEWQETEESLSAGVRRAQDEIYRRYASGEEDWLLMLGFQDPPFSLSPSLEFWRRLARRFVAFVSRVADLESLRGRGCLTLEPEEFEEFVYNAPAMTGLERLNALSVRAQWNRLNDSFKSALKAFDGTAEDFVRSLNPDVHVAGRVYFHLVENKDGDLPFAFLATYTTRLDDQGKSRHLPLQHALKEYGRDGAKLLELLATVHRAAQKSKLVADMLETGELFHPLAWKTGEAFTFLNEIPVYEAAGILCRIPDWWKGARAGLRVNITVGGNAPSIMGMEAVLNFDARLFIGDAEISEEEARALMEEARGLAFIKNKWVAADPEKIRKTLDAYEKARELMEKEGMTLREALRFQLRPDAYLAADADDEGVSVSNGQWLASVMRKLSEPAGLSPAFPGDGFKATLRPYQQEGLNWLWFLHTLGFGACLADDMGLGKTVQVLGFLSALAAGNDNGKKASLLVIPASLLANWVNEIEKFAPGLSYYVAHPEAHKSKAVTPKSGKAIDRLDLVITTYALAQRYEWLQKHEWAYVILDEAQAIKNPGTKQTRAVKKLSTRNRIVMTGTPIENRLSDLWSLFDFLNPGLLGTAREFTAFSKTLKDNAKGYARLRKIVRPYILRRLKTDKSVISDLPDKVEMKTYAALTPKQAVLYRKLVDDIRETIEATDGMQRRGMILAALMKFKQICNHPDQYKGGGRFSEKESGKFERLREICETILEKREKVLVFTQFKEMTDPLEGFLTQIFGRPGLVLHGGAPVGKRKKIIETFQNGDYTPFMVLSLKAGGVGLNLTEANHVVHFDRWWNPAVENQATDRAFRIGQKKNVVVHKFLTRGTVEEKIDRMLEEKAKLSREVIAETGEKWITEMETDEIMDLFQLSL